MENNIILDVKNGTATFTIDNLIGINTNEMYLGDFTVKTFLTFEDRARAERIKLSILGPHAALANEMTQNIAWSLSQLEVRVLRCPPWWNATNSPVRGNHLSDDNLLATLVDMALMAQDLYQKEIRANIKKKLTEVKEQIETMEKAHNES